MNDRVYELCSSYVGEFLTIINYSDDGEDIALFNVFREAALVDAKSDFENSPRFNDIVKEINDDYDQKIFDYIKEKVANVSPDFFNLKIRSLNKLLSDFHDEAVRLGMVLPATNIADYYGNYLIAMDYLTRKEFKESLPQF